ASLFVDDIKSELDSESDIEVWELLKNISSLGVKISEKSISFHPMMIWEGKRTFSIEDITDDDYEVLKKLDYEKIPLNLRVRVTDILWSLKKEYSAARVAVKSYFELFTLWFSLEKWTGSLNMIRRAICISAQIRDEDSYQKSCDYILNQVVSIDGQDEGFLSLRLLDILIFHKYKDLQTYIGIANKIISTHYDNVSKVEQSYSVIQECYMKMKKQADARKANVLLADYYVEYADKIIGVDMQGAMRAEGYLQKAVLLYRNNDNSNKAEETHRKLVSVQKEIPQLMVPFSTEVDVSGLYKSIDLNLRDLSIEESIVRLTQMIVLYKKDEMKNKVVEEYKNYPLSHLFGKNMINESGQTVFTLPPLNLDNIEADEELLNFHINQKMMEEGKIAGDMCIKYALYRIRQNHEIKREDIDFLVKDNPIIPEGRERIFGSAIYMILCGQYYEGIHILAPQIENLFRCIAKEVGGLTVTLENDGTSKEKVLSSVFDLPELVDCYDNDILYLFKALLNEQSGANIRNEIAHGIVNEANASSGVYLYFAIVVIKLLALTSVECYSILKTSDKLKNFIVPEKDAIKINSKNP
ncbi:MAG: DUF4209 domain-containing protein, partial [Lachnospiraceae bacterium]|nr:DUF4209 domain-containing protein [Lachnospiraceae bacterium]